MTSRIFLKLIVAVLCILAVALTAVDFLASEVAEKTYISTLTRNLGDESRMLALLMDRGAAKGGDTLYREIAETLKGRLTLVAGDGRVIWDSEAQASHMENHRSRPEIIDALTGRQGSSKRLSPTLGTPFLYVAVPFSQGALRLAVPLAVMSAEVDAIRRKMLTAMALAFLPAFVVAAFFARHVSARLGRIIEYAGKLAEGNFEARLAKPGTDELGTLGSKLNETGEKLQHTVEQLQREHVELEKLERVRKDFVINVSHELRTPLASIQGYTETLLDGAIHDADHNVKFLSIIRANAERLGRLTADLLTLSRIELKTQKFQFASYYVNTLIMDSVDSIRPIADKKSIVLQTELGSARTEVFCDSEAVHQILVNLLDNAIKYTPEGGTITVGTNTLPVASGGVEHVEIFVKDSGMGIPDEDLPRLFERFYRVDKARSRELGGTGLGLAIVKHLSKAQGGEVRVSSQLQKGSTFSFTLPVEDLGLAEYGSVQAQLTGP
ncbi:MAG: ATP-binding protein [Bryobacteraceae bacterium]|nr:ATP-binding protein [Bryobacteraceae bacterium]